MRGVVSIVALIAALLGTGFLGLGRAGWREGPPLPEPRWFHGSGAGPEGRIAVFGGYVISPRGLREYGLKEYSIRVFDPETNQWRAGPPVPAYHDRVRLSVFGAEPPRLVERVGPPLRARHELPQGASDALGRVFWFIRSGQVFFDLARGEWDQPAPPLYIQDERRFEGSVPTMVHGQGATVLSADGRLFRIGGVGHPISAHDSWKLWELMTHVDYYDPASNTWGEAAPMPRLRQLHAAALGRDGRIYVFGGCACTSSARVDPEAEDPMRAVRRNSFHARRSVKEVDIYDPETNRWSEGAPMPRPRQMMGAATGADGRIYVVGGVPAFSRGDSLRHVDIYDPRADTWSRGPSLRHPRHGHTVVSLPDGRIFAIGGNAYREGLLRRLFGTVVTHHTSVEVLETRPLEETGS